MLLNNQNLGTLNGDEFGFDHQYSDEEEEDIHYEEHNDNKDYSYNSERNKLEDEYNQKLIDLKNNYSQFSRTNGHLENESNNNNQNCFNLHSQQEVPQKMNKKDNLAHSYSFPEKHPTQIRRTPKSNHKNFIQPPESPHPKIKHDSSTYTRKKITAQSVNIEEEPRDIPKTISDHKSINRSEKTVSKEQNLYPSFARNEIPNSSLSAYKKNMVFSGKLCLHKIEFGNKKMGILKFDIEYEKNFIPAKKNHEINGYSTMIKEKFIVPFKAIYDRRKRQFITEPIRINVMNIHKKYNKKLGYALLSISNVLNKQLVYYNGPLKLQKSSDRGAKLHVIVNLKFETFTDKDKNFERKSNYHFDDSYFSWKTERYILKILIIIIIININICILINKLVVIASQKI